VSGFAYGVDIVAHQFAMEYKLQTIGVVAHGLNQIYPKPHKNICGQDGREWRFYDRILSASNPDKENFVRRNRIAGMTEATIVMNQQIVVAL
jgi:DNA processing protein